MSDLCGNGTNADQKICNKSCSNLIAGEVLNYDCNGCNNGGGSNTKCGTWSEICPNCPNGQTNCEQCETDPSKWQCKG